MLIVPALTWVDLRVLDFEGSAVVAVECVLERAERRESEVTDPEGRASLRVFGATDGVEASLVIDRPSAGWMRPETIRFGALPPVETAAGQRVRLDNLGYVPMPTPGVDEPEDAPSRWAIEEFQCEQGLFVDGVCGPDTQAALTAAHES